MSDELPALPAKVPVDKHLPTGVLLYGWTADQMRDYAAAAVAAERERIRADLMRRHRDSADRHNFYACLAVELFGEPPA
jgi:hypothetical protein